MRDALKIIKADIGMNIELTIEQKDFFAKSSHGFKSEDRHFVGIFKTRLLKYKDFTVNESGVGNIVSYTRLFPAEDSEDAEQKALSHFHCWNPTFSPLSRECMKVEHVLLGVEEIIPPEPNGDFRHIHKLDFSPMSGWGLLGIKVHDPHKIPIKEPYLRNPDFIIHRIQQHLDSREADAYICHPRGGSSDKGVDWWMIKKGDGRFGEMAKMFAAYNKFFGEQFKHTEYTDLNAAEQELVKRRWCLEYLDNTNSMHLGYDQLSRAQLKQGYYTVRRDIHNKITDVIFNEDKHNWSRFRYLTREDKKIELHKELQELERRKDLLNVEISIVKRQLEAE